MIEPVAWALYWNTGDLCRFTKYEPDAQEFLIRAKEDRHKNPSVVPLCAIPPGYTIVPVEPTEAMWGGLARDIMFVLRQERPTPKKLLYHLEHLHEKLPDWLLCEPELHNKESDHVITKGTCCVLIYKAMLSAAAKGE